MYEIEIAPAAERALKKFPADIRNRIFKNILTLKENPRPHGVKKLSSKGDIYRIRAGDYRIVYQIQDTALIILVVNIGHRREIYR